MSKTSRSPPPVDCRKTRGPPQCSHGWQRKDECGSCLNCHIPFACVSRLRHNAAIWTRDGKLHQSPANSILQAEMFASAGVCGDRKHQAHGNCSIHPTGPGSDCLGPPFYEQSQEHAHLQIVATQGEQTGFNGHSKSLGLICHLHGCHCPAQSGLLAGAPCHFRTMLHHSIYFATGCKSRRALCMEKAQVVLTTLQSIC